MVVVVAVPPVPPTLYPQFTLIPVVPSLVDRHAVPLPDTTVALPVHESDEYILVVHDDAAVLDEHVTNTPNSSPSLADDKHLPDLLTIRVVSLSLDVHVPSPYTYHSTSNIDALLLLLVPTALSLEVPVELEM